MSWIAVIPARWGSTRFPGKALTMIGGLPMVVRTARRAGRAQCVEKAVVATDDQRIADVCRDHGLDYVMTASDHVTGTDRVVEAARVFTGLDVVNVQGDEPLIAPSAIDKLVDGLGSGGVLVANAACPLGVGEADDRNVVKAVPDLNGRLLFLSRSPIPSSSNGPILRRRHLGLYAFRGDALSLYGGRSQGPIELAESVEMYRFIEYGDPIILVDLPKGPPAVDVPTDVKQVDSYVEANGGWSVFD